MSDGRFTESLRKASIAVFCSLAFLGCATSETKPDDQRESDLGPYEEAAQTPDEPTVVAYDHYNDPLQVINRPIFKFNDITYRYVLIPLGKGYQTIVPEPASTSISNVFFNLREPLYVLNNLFQWKPVDSGKSLLRFGINSTLGLLGLFDPAEAWWDISRKDTTFGDTLAHYGVGYGAYVVIPLLGPSDLRDGASSVFEYFAHPLQYEVGKRQARALLTFEGFHNRVPELVRYKEVVGEAEDPYIFVRNFYLQSIQRDAVELRPDETHSAEAGEEPQ